MRIGVFSDSLPRMGRREMLAWCAARGITDVEIGVGAWGPWPRPHLDLATVGGGRDDAAWSALFAAVRRAGYDGVVSIEHEDPRYDGPEGTERSRVGLGRALDRLARAA